MLRFDWVDVTISVPRVASFEQVHAISDAVEHWLDTHRPDVIAIERVFSQQNVSTVMGTRAGRRCPVKSRPRSPATPTLVAGFQLSLSVRAIQLPFRRSLKETDRPVYVTSVRATLRKPGDRSDTV